MASRSTLTEREKQLKKANRLQNKAKRFSIKERRYVKALRDQGVEFTEPPRGPIKMPKSALGRALFSTPSKSRIKTIDPQELLLHRKRKSGAYKRLGIKT